MDDELLLLVLYIVMGIVLMGLSVPLMRNKIKPNGWYGFRIPKTMNDPAIWYAVNHHYSYRLFWAGAACVLAAIVFRLVPGLSLDAYALAVLGVFGAVFIISLVQSIRYMNTL